MIFRKCYCCKFVKPLEQFSKAKSRPLGYSYRCNDCGKKLWKEADKNSGRGTMRGKYPKEYAAFYAGQNGQCAICGKTSKRALSLDHCHKTGDLRGLLCYKCNYALGLFEDKIPLLVQAIAYLDNATSARNKKAARG